MTTSNDKMFYISTLTEKIHKSKHLNLNELKIQICKQVVNKKIFQTATKKIFDLRMISPSRVNESLSCDGNCYLEKMKTKKKYFKLKLKS